MNKVLSKILIFGLIIQLIGLGVFLFPKKASAAALTEVVATPANVEAGATTNHRIDFKTATSIPNNGKITIQFPAGFNVLGATFVSWSGLMADRQPRL